MEMHQNQFILFNYNRQSTKLFVTDIPFYEEQLQYFLTSGECILVPSDTVIKELGITFLSNLRWSVHVSNIIKTAKKQSWWVLSSFRDRSPTVILTLGGSMVI